MDLEVLNLKANSSEVDNATESTEKLDRSLSRVDKTIDKVENSLKVMRGQLIEAADGSVKLSEGMTRSQSNMLAMMRQAGATGSQLKQLNSLFEQYNKISGVNKFDKSVQALSFIKQQREELSKSIKYAEQFNFLTKEQISLLSRGVEAVKQKGRAQRLSFEEGTKATNEFITSFVQEAKAYNDSIRAIEEKNKAHKEELLIQRQLATARAEANAASMREWAGGVGKQSQELKEMAAYYEQLGREADQSAKTRVSAEKYVQEELQRTLFINKQLEGGLGQGAANAMYKYKQQLDMIGLSADQVAAKMKEFQSALTQNQTLRNNRSPFKQMSEDVRQVGTEVNQLARAVSVQMGDVFVSLAGGMNPLLVAIQQGDQVRFALEQAAAAGQSMDKVMQGAFKSMANSFILVGKIVSDFLIDGFKALGSVFNGLLNTMPVFGNMITGWEMGFKRTAAQGDLFSKVVVGLAGAANIAMGAMVAFGAFIGGVYLNALIKADQQQSQLAKSLGQYGASLGVAIDEVRAFAVASEESTGTVVDAIGAIAKAGGFTAEQMKIVAVSAAEMNRVFGTSIDNIVSKYKDLQKDPVKTLLELQARTGDVNETLINKIRKMQEEGREYAAIGAAMEEYAAANKRTTDRTVENLGVIATVLSKISEGWRLLYKEIESLAASPTALENLLKAGKEVEELRKAAGSETDKIRQEVLKRELAIAEQNLEVVKKTWVEENKANELRRQRSELAELELKHTDTIKNAKPEQIKFAEKQLELQNDYNRALQNGASPEFLAGLSSAMQKNAKDYEEYLKRANKPPEGAKALENYFERISEKVSDLKIKVTDEYNSMTQGTSKMISAQKLLLDILNDDKWSKLTKSQQEKVKADIEEVAAVEKKVQLIKEELALTELLAEFSKVSEENKATIQEETDALQLRNDLLFKTEEEAKAIQRQYDLNLKLVQIENKYIAQRNDLIANYVKMVKEGTLNAANMDAYNKAMIELVRQEAQERQLAHQDANMKIVEDYAAKFKEIQSTVTDIIATAMFEGGKAGSKKLKDVLKAEFRKYVIKVFIEPVVGQVMGSVFGASGGSFAGGGTGGSTGGIFGLPGGGDIGSNIVSFLDESAMSAIGSGYTSLGEGLSSLSGTINSANTYLKSIPGFEGGVSSVLGYANAFGTAMDGQYGKALGQAIGTYILPGIGTFIGGAIGDMLGWNKKPSDKTSSATIDLTSGRITDIWDMGGKKAASQEQKDANAQLSQLIGSFAALTGLTGQLVTAMGSRDGIRVAIEGGFKTPEGAAAGGAWLGGKETAYNYGSDPATAAVKMMEDLLDEGTLSQSVIDSWEALKTTAEGTTKDAVELIGNLDLLVAGFDEEAVRRADLIQQDNESIQNAFMRMKEYERVLSGAVAQPGGPMAEAISKLETSFAKMGVSLPKTIEDFNGLIQGLDMTTESGKQTYATLMELFPAWFEIESAQKALYDGLMTSQEKVAESSSEMSMLYKDLGISIPRSTQELRALIDAQDESTEAGAKLRAQLLGTVPVYLEWQEQMVNSFGITADRVREIFSTVLQESGSAKEAAQKASEMFSQQVYDALLGSVLNSVTEMVFSGIITPMINSLVSQTSIAATSMATGGTIAGTAVSTGGVIAGQELATVVDKINVYLGAMSQILSDPAIKAAIDDISKIVGGVAGSVYTTGSGYRKQPTTVASSSSGRNETNEVADSLKKYSDENKRLQAELLELQGKTQEAKELLRALAIEGLTPLEIKAYDANQVLRDQIESMKEAQRLEKEIADQRKSLETQLLQLQGNTVELRKRELEALHESNRGLQEMIWHLEDAKTAIEATKEASIKGADVAMEAVDKAFNALQRAVDREKEIVQSRIDVLENSLSKLKGVFDFLKTTIDSLLGGARSVSGMRLSQANEVIQKALLSGIIPDEKAFEDAVGTAVQGVEKGIYASRADQERATILLANDLSKINLSVGDQISETERLIALEKKELERLDKILETAQRQIDVLKGIDNSVISVGQAINNLAAAILGAEKAKIVAAAAPYVATQSTIAANYSASGGVVNSNAAKTVSSAEKTIADIYNNVLGRDADIGGLNYWVSSGLTTSQIEASIKESAEAAARAISTDVQNAFLQGVASSVGQTTNIKAYADGGYYSGGLALVGEEGSELINFNRPGQVYNNKQTRNILEGVGDNAALVEELINLRNEVTMLRAETRAVVSNTSKSAKLLDRAMPDGQSILVTTTA